MTVQGFWSKHFGVNLPQKWRDAFEQLMDKGLYSQTEALDAIARQHGMDRTTGREVSLRYWAGFHITNKIVDAIIREAYERSGSEEPLTLAELTDRIYEVSGVRFRRERTLLILDRRYEVRMGEPLLREVSDGEPKRYLPYRPVARVCPSSHPTSPRSESGGC